ncbi:MAG: transglycosylase SLT domain-containing protein [Candidatus Zixiibacteriota bacterium]
MDISAVTQTGQPIEKKDIGKISGDEPLEVKKLKLKKVTEEFESFFLLYMLKAMRKTVPESGLLEGGPGKEIYTGIMDEEMARKLSGTSSGSLADILYKSMEPQLEATYATETGQTADVDTNIKSLPRLPVDRGQHKESMTATTTEKKTLPLPAATVKPAVHSDEILGKYGKIIDKAAEEYDISPQLIYSVIVAESGGNPEAISNKGAKGLMQLMDSTASEMGVSDSLDVHQNIMGGTKYLRKMLDTFDGDVKKALAAYNAGPGTVSKYNGVPPYPETRQYVDKIVGKMSGAKKF